MHILYGYSVYSVIYNGGVAVETRKYRVNVGDGGKDMIVRGFFT